MSLLPYALGAGHRNCITLAARSRNDVKAQEE